MDRKRSTERLRAHIEATCRRKGLRMTGQRRAVIDIIAELRDHPDTEELHRRVRVEDAPHFVGHGLSHYDRVG